MASKSSLGLLAGVVAVGAGLFFMSSRSSAAPAKPAPTPAEGELAQLYKQNPQLYGTVTQALSTVTSPVDLSRLQQAVQFAYPNLGAALKKRLDDTTISVPVFVSGRATPLVFSLDPQGHVHVYTGDFTEVAVVGAPPNAQSAPSIASRNPSSSFDGIIQALSQPSMATSGGSLGWLEIFDRLQAMTYGPRASA